MTICKQSYVGILLLGILLLSSCAHFPSARLESRGHLVLAQDGKALMKIAVNSADLIPAEKTAAEELRDYLKKIAGADFEIVEESDLAAEASAIYVGRTQFAKTRGVEFEKLGTEESVLRTTDGNLILTGGRPRGTLYAVYELLENELGCRWYTPWAEIIPQKATLTIAALDKKVKPRLMYRDHHTQTMQAPSLEAWTCFNARNRMNGCGTYLHHPSLKRDFGGAIKGGRSNNHSFNLLIPAEKYFKDHPEYFSMRNGKRVPSTMVNGNQLCLTNPDVLKIVIRETRKDIKDYPDAFYYAVSVNDGGGPTICDCPECAKVQQEEGVSGLLLQFVNAVADDIKQDYPDKYILTLSYCSTRLPPKRIKARDNVIVYVCQGFRSEAIYLPKGNDSREMKNMIAWTSYAKHVWAWDYACECYSRMNYFRPILWKMFDQLTICRQVSIDGIFQENELLAAEDSMFTQFYEMNMWILTKLMTNPDQDLDALIDDFLNGYYGKAEVFLRKYVDLLHKRLPQYPFTMFNYAFVQEAQRLFDEAEAAVLPDAELLGRVRDLRIGLDLATLAYRSQLIRDYLRQGGKLPDYPYKTAVLKQRILDTLDKTRNPYILYTTTRPKEGGGVNYVPIRDIARKYTLTLCEGKDYVPLPARFQALPPGNVIERLAPQMALKQPADFFVPDAESEFGLAVTVTGTNLLHMVFGATDLLDNKDAGRKQFKYEDISRKGYHLYQGPRIKLSEWTWVYTFTYQIQEHLYSLYDPAKPDQEWDVYVSARFEGTPPFSDSHKPEGIYVDRLFLVKRTQENGAQK